jgi:hypothetical protein
MEQLIERDRQVGEAVPTRLVVEGGAGIASAETGQDRTGDGDCATGRTLTGWHAAAGGLAGWRGLLAGLCMYAGYVM